MTLGLFLIDAIIFSLLNFISLITLIKIWKLNLKNALQVNIVGLKHNEHSTRAQVNGKIVMEH